MFLRRYSAKETYNLIDPTDRSHPIYITRRVCVALDPACLYESSIHITIYICYKTMITRDTIITRVLTRESCLTYE